MKLRNLLIILLLGLLISGPGSARASTRPAGASPLAAPQLKWSGGGCFSWGCQTGWYASPAAADLDGDGQVEVIGAAYDIFVLDGATGALEWRAASGHDRSQSGASAVGRTWPSPAVADLEGDGDLEIITAHSSGWLAVYDHQGYFQAGWPQQVTPDNELRSLAVADLEGDGDLEILAASTRSSEQWFAFEHDGSLRPSAWPQHGPDSDTNGFTAGCFNQNLAAADLDGDGRAEIIGPNDTHYVAAFEDDGAQVRAGSIFGTIAGSPKVWSRVGVNVDEAADLRGWTECETELRPNFAHSAPVIADLDGNGTYEAVIVGNVYNCDTSPYTDLYEMPFIFNGDRTRWSGAGQDWTVLPSPDGQAAPLSENYNVIENNNPNPVTVDLDNDGVLEILYPSYDGRMHAYWVDKTEHGSWPYSVTQPAEGIIRFASEPAAADLDRDGRLEVIFASWTQKGSGRSGKLHILDYLGNPLWEVDLPNPASHDWNGSLAAPTLANIDADPDLEVVLNTAHSGLVAYDLPGAAASWLVWPTSRGGNLRSGAALRLVIDFSQALFLPLMMR